MDCTTSKRIGDHPPPSDKASSPTHVKPHDSCVHEPPGVHTHLLVSPIGRYCSVSADGEAPGAPTRPWVPYGVVTVGVGSPIQTRGHTRMKVHFPTNKSCPHQSNSEWGHESYGLLAPPSSHCLFSSVYAHNMSMKCGVGLNKDSVQIFRGSWGPIHSIGGSGKEHFNAKEWH